MLFNFLVILFLLLMIAMWSHYGFFNGLLHLLATIVAGALALALWEPMVFGIQFRAENAWGVENAWGAWLLALFAVLLRMVRVVIDKVVRSNMSFGQITSLVGGGTCGLASGILTAGLMVIGLGFLPLGVSIFGYQPLVVGAGGEVTKNQSLWIPVDRMAADFYTRLSGGSFYSGQSLGEYLPDLARRAEEFRLRADPNASVTAIPESVGFDLDGRVSVNYFRHKLPDHGLAADLAEVLNPYAEGKGLRDPAPNLVLIDTVVKNSAPPYDSDGILRVPPAHVRLLASPAGKTGATMAHAPVAFVKVDSRGERTFQHIDSRDASADSPAADQAIFGWVFMLPAEVEPRYLLFRHLRLKMPEVANTTPKDVWRSLRYPEEGEHVDTVDPGNGTSRRPDFRDPSGRPAGHRPADPTVTAKLPRMIHRNMIGGTLRINAQNRILSGRHTVHPPSGQIPRGYRIESVYVPKELICLRVRLERDQARSLLGRAPQLARELGSAHLRDQYGSTYQPFGYVWQKQNGDQVIHFTGTPIRAARQVPVSRMKKGDKMFLYFKVERGRGLSIRSYQIGEKSWPIDPPLELP